MNERVEKLLRDRYYVGDEDSWEELTNRVIDNLFQEETGLLDYEVEDIREMLLNKYFIASSPCLMNAGTNVQQLSSCFILDIEEDTLESIMEVASQSSKVFQKNGGKLIASLQQ